MINIDKGSVKFGTSFVEGVKQTLGQTYEAVKEAVPVVGQVEEFYAGSEERAQSRLLERGFISEQIQAADVEKQQYTKTGEATSQFLDTVSDVTNIDRDLIGAGAFVLENLVEPGYGGAVAFKRGAAAFEMRDVTRLQRSVALAADPAQNYYLTLKDPANIPEGIKKGSAFKDPKFAPQMVDFYQRRANIKERLQAAADRKSKRVGKLKEEGYNTISTGPSRAPELDPEAYGDKKAFERFKEQSEITPLTPSGNVKWQQQHHMFSKQESYQFVERMIELGDDDDVLALFIMAEDMDAAMGGRLSNMLNMEDLPHSVLHGSRITDKRQLQSAQMRNLVENAKSPDELMRMFRKYVTDNVQPSKEEAKAFKIIGQRLLKADKYGDLEKIRDKMYR